MGKLLDFFRRTPSGYTEAVAKEQAAIAQKSADAYAKGGQTETYEERMARQRQAEQAKWKQSEAQRTYNEALAAKREAMGIADQQKVVEIRESIDGIPDKKEKAA